MNPIKVAIVGTGSIANAHLDGLKSVGDRVRLVAGVDTDAKRVAAFCAEKNIPRSYTDVAAMLAAERPDLVHICTPPGSHCDISVQCLDGGAWVLCEKPLCASLAELDRLAAAEQRTGKYCSCVFQWRFGSAGQHVKKLVEANAMGRPLVGLCNTTWYRGLAYYAVPWRGKWATELGGPTMGHGIHAMDFFLWVMGDWREVRAMMGTLDRKIEVEDVSMALVRFENRAMGSIVNSVLSPREESYVRFDCQEATVEVKHLYGYANENWQFTAIPDVTAEKLNGWKSMPANVPCAHGPQIAALLDSFAKNERPLVSGHEARRTIEFLTALYKSAITGQPVTRGSIRPGDPFYEKIHGGTGWKDV
jgi:predicted dehydrogenase